MAVNPRDIPITRAMIQAWIEEARAAKVNKRNYVRQKIDDMNLDDPFIDVSTRDDFSGRRVHLKDYLDRDFASYQ